PGRLGLMMMDASDEKFLLARANLIKSTGDLRLGCAALVRAALDEAIESSGEIALQLGELPFADEMRRFCGDEILLAGEMLTELRSRAGAIRCRAQRL